MTGPTNTIKEYSILDSIREEAKRRAKERINSTNRRNAISYPHPKDYTRLEIDWQGLLGELMIHSIDPRYRIAHFPPIGSTDLFHESYPKIGIEVKCNRFPLNFTYNIFLVNRETHDKMEYLSEVLIATFIRSPPDIAKKIYILGWMPIEEVSKSKIKYFSKSSAYEVPTKDFRDMDELPPYLQRVAHI